MVIEEVPARIAEENPANEQVFQLSAERDQTEVATRGDQLGKASGPMS